MEINKNLITSFLLNKSNDGNIKNNLSNVLIEHKVSDKPLVVVTDITDSLKDILQSSGLNVSFENIKMLQYLLDNNIALDNDTLQNIYKGIKLFNIIENNTHKSTDSFDNINNKSYLKEDKKNNDTMVSIKNHNIDKSIFMINNDISINTTNAYLLENVSSRKAHLTSMVTSLAESIYNISDIQLRNNLITALLKDISFDIVDETLYNKPYPNSLILDEKQLLTLKENTDNIKQKLIDNSFTITELNRILNEFSPLTESDIFHIATLLFKDNPLVRDEFIIKLNKNKMGIFSKEQLVSTLINEITLDYNSNNIKYIDNILNTLYLNLTTIEGLLSNSNHPNVLEKASYVKDTLEFLNQMNDITYIPLPISVGKKLLESELFIFKDKRSKSGMKKAVSALIALNTLNIGRVETYIQKNNKKLNLQFRLENINAEAIIKSNINNLNNLLSTFNYTLQSYSIVPLDQPFNILSKEPLKFNNSTNNHSNTTFDTKA